MGTIDENTNDENSVIEEKEFDHVKDSAWKGINLFFKELLDISKDTDREATIEGVKKDISYDYNLFCVSQILCRKYNLIVTFHEKG